jgi:hypothetical protein
LSRNVGKGLTFDAALYPRKSAVLISIAAEALSPGFTEPLNRILTNVRTAFSATNIYEHTQVLLQSQNSSRQFCYSRRTAAASFVTVAEQQPPVLLQSQNSSRQF